MLGRFGIFSLQCVDVGGILFTTQVFIKFLCEFLKLPNFLANRLAHTGLGSYFPIVLTERHIKRTTTLVSFTDA